MSERPQAQVESTRLRESPRGRECIGMTLAGREWIYYTAKALFLAGRLRSHLKKEFNVDSIYGPCLNIEESIAKRKIVLVITDLSNVRRGEPIGEEINDAVGIFIPEGDYDRIMDITSTGWPVDPKKVSPLGGGYSGG